MENTDELLNYYRKRYEGELVRANQYYEVLSDAVVEQARQGNDPFLIVDLQEQSKKIEELERVLQSPGELLKRGKADDLKVNERVVNNYQEKKAKYESTSPFQKLRQKIANRITSFGERISDENESGRSL